MRLIFYLFIIIIQTGYKFKQSIDFEMASTKFELLRSACETVESSEKVLAIAYQNQKKFAKKSAVAASGAEQQIQEAQAD